MEAQDLSHFVRHPADGVAAMDLVVNGVYCGACIVAIEKGLGRQAGVRGARVNLAIQARHRRMERRRARAAGHPRAARGARLPGFSRSPPRRPTALELQEEKRLLRCLGVAAFGAMNVMLLSVSLWAGAEYDSEFRDARPVPLALGARRAAVRGLCRHAVLRERGAVDPRGRAQHGRPDLARRHPRVWRCRCCRPSRISTAPISRAP